MREPVVERSSLLSRESSATSTWEGWARSLITAVLSARRWLETKCFQYRAYAPRPQAICHLKQERIKIPIATTRAFSLTEKLTDLDFVQPTIFFPFHSFYHLITFLIVHAKPDGEIERIKYGSCDLNDISRILEFSEIFIIISRFFLPISSSFIALFKYVRCLIYSIFYLQF